MVPSIYVITADKSIRSALTKLKKSSTRKHADRDPAEGSRKGGRHRRGCLRTDGLELEGS